MYVVFQNVTFQIEAFYSFDCWIFLTKFWVLPFQMQFWSKSACTASLEHAPLASQSKIWSFIWTSLIHLWTSSSCEKPLTRKLITIQVSVLLREDNNRSHLISQSWRLDESSTHQAGRGRLSRKLIWRCHMKILIDIDPSSCKNYKWKFFN